MDKIPFSVYDFFGYLAAGYVLMVGLAASFAGNEDWEHTPGTIVGLLLIVAAYSTGHLVANVSGHLIEGKLVRKVLGTPSIVLFAKTESRWSKLLPGYFRTLPEEQRTTVLERARAAGVHERGEGLFFHCFGVVKEHDWVMSRLNTFLNLYGFCRNMSLACLVVAITLIVGSLLGTAHTGSIASPGWWAVGAFCLAIGLLYRYLKFLRQYGLEVFISYAALA